MEFQPPFDCGAWNFRQFFKLAGDSMGKVTRSQGNSLGMWMGAPASGFVGSPPKHLLAKFILLGGPLPALQYKGASVLIRSGRSSRIAEVCYNGIEIDHLLDRRLLIQESPEIERISSPEARTILLYVGGMIDREASRFAARCFFSAEKDGAKTVLWLVGDGPDRGRFKITVSPWHFKCTLPGPHYR